MAVAKVLGIRRGVFFPLARKPFTCFHGTGERRFSWATADREQLRRVAARHGVTSNDAFLAAVATALRHWPHTPWRGGRPRPVWTLMPVDLRGRAGDSAPGCQAASL